LTVTRVSVSVNPPVGPAPRDGSASGGGRPGAEAEFAEGDIVEQQLTREELMARVRWLEEHLARAGLCADGGDASGGEGPGRGKPFESRKAVSSTADAAHIVGPDLRILFVTDSFKQWNQRLGLDPDPTGKALLEIFSFLPDSVVVEYRTVFDTGTMLTTEEWVTVEDERICTETRKIPLQQDGRVDRVLTVIRDITEIRKTQESLESLADQQACELLAANERLRGEMAKRQRIDQALRLSEQMYRTLVESAGESIATVDGDGVFRFMNAVGARRLGGAPEDFVGRSMWDLFPKAIADRQMDSVRRVLATGQGMNVIVPTELQGQTRWYNTTVEPVRDGGGRVALAMVIARDIHDLKLAQEQLEKHREEMARTEHLASLGAISAATAHELTQPLTVVNLAVENACAALEDVPGTDGVKADLADAVKGIEGIVAVVNRFRRFAGRSTEKGVAALDLHGIAQGAIRLLDEKAWRAGMTITANGLRGLPAVTANEKDMEQMFFLLIENAIQAAHDNKPNHLVISGKARRNTVELVFEDDGCGIPHDIQDNVFEPFFTTKPPGQGTGLGLCVVERIVSRVGGGIKVASRPGRGTRFHITLPAEPPGH